MQTANGPLPKDPAKRVRRNKEAPTETLVSPAPKPPRRPSHVTIDGESVKILAATVEWWDGWKANPCTARFEATDWQRLKLLLPQVDQYYRTGNPRFLAEIRQTEAELGGTVVGRLRLKVNIQRPDGVDAKPAGSGRRRGLHVVA